MTGISDFIINFILPAIVVGLPIWVVWYIRSRLNNPSTYKAKGVVRIYRAPDALIDVLLKHGAEIRAARHELKVLARRKFNAALDTLLPEACVNDASTIYTCCSTCGKRVAIMCFFPGVSTENQSGVQFLTEGAWYDVEFVTWPKDLELPEHKFHERKIPERLRS